MEQCLPGKNWQLEILLRSINSINMTGNPEKMPARPGPSGDLVKMGIDQSVFVEHDINHLHSLKNHCIL
jgi:hypothetical protein